MKSFLANIGKFIFIASLIYSILIILVGNFLPQAYRPNLIYPEERNGLTKQQFCEVDSVENIDILFLGNSHARRGFDPRIFRSAGFSSFNFGSAAQTPIQTELLLNRYYQQLNPKLIVYEVSPLSFMSQGVESAQYLTANDEFDFNNFIMAIRTNHLKIYNVTIFAFFKKLIFNIKDTNPVFIGNKNDVYIKGGYSVRNVHPYQKRYVAKRNKIIKFNNKQLNVFSEIVDDLRASGSKVFLVQAPVTKGFYKSYLNNNYFDSVMQAYGNYINFNEIMFLEDTVHFFDHHHLHPNGTKVFNRELLEFVRKVSL